MKFLILGFAKIKFMPYIHFYMDLLKNTSHEVHIVYWNRDLQPEILPFENCTYHEFRYEAYNSKNKLNKLLPFFKYRSFVKDILKSNSFDRVIALHTFPGFLLSDILTKKYKNRYIFDFRDVTYERFKFFRKRIENLVLNSFVTYCSSRGFLPYLPRTDKILISHNFLSDSLQKSEIIKTSVSSSSPIKISFWGLIRNPEINSLILEKLGGDPRFELHYFGSYPQSFEELINLCKTENYSNIFFHGEYAPNERYNFIRNTDIVHNIYDDFNMRIAVSNKIYDGIIFKIPQLCLKNSHMGNFIEENGIGLACDPNSNAFADEIYNYYTNLKFESFSKNCEDTLSCVLREYEQNLNKLKEFFI